MSEISILSYLSNIDWSAGFQWYLNNLDVGYLIWALEEGRAFTNEDWMSMMLLTANLVVLLALVYQLIKRYRETELRLSVEERLSHISSRPAKEIQGRLEAKVSTLPA